MHTWGDCVHNPEINLPVVDIIMETVIIIDWGREHIIPTEKGEGGRGLNVDITLPKLLLLFLLFTSNMLLSIMFCLMTFLK